MTVKKRKIFLAAGFLLFFGLLQVFLYSFGNKTQETGLIIQKENPIPSGNPPTSESITDEETDSVLFVHICGAIQREGVYNLPSGSRINDVVMLSGGFTEEADTTYLNLAAFLFDGQKVYVPTREEAKSMEPVNTPELSISPEEKRVNLNTASLEQLMELNGIGKAKAEEILHFRKKVGRFQKAEELMQVPGIGEALYEKLKTYIYVE